MSTPLNPHPRALVMGIVNTTPDSFSDGGRYLAPEAAVAHGLRLLDEGADLLDIGGESTRPGAAPVSPADQKRRVIPVIEGILTARPDTVVSVDTASAAVAEAGLDAGARWVNDVTALGDPDMAPLCAERGCELVLMHMRGEPRTMQRDTVYDDLVGEVITFLGERVARAVAAGVDRDRIVLDPGLGFGKAPTDNPRLIAAVPRLRQGGHRVLIGASRKRFVGALTGVEQPADRVYGSVGAALAAASLGADVLRVHDVAATVQALAVQAAVYDVARQLAAS
jgi:dihydropteroate synthase